MILIPGLLMLFPYQLLLHSRYLGGDDIIEVAFINHPFSKGDQRQDSEPGGNQCSDLRL